MFILSSLMQVIMYDPDNKLAIDNLLPKAEADIILSIESSLYKHRLELMLADHR